MLHIGHCNRLAHPDPQVASCDVVMWDGRLDNRAELLVRFGRANASGVSDVALVRAAYDSERIQGLGRLIGDWSLVLLDRRTGLVVLASDFTGVRPLYYCERAGVVHWSTSLDALVARMEITALDERYIAGFLLLGGYPSLTPYEGIRSVPPGQAVCFHARATTLEPFWTMPSGDLCRYRDERRYEEQVQALFKEAVAVRLAGRRPVSAELSGGFDSSSVVCMASHLIQSGAVAAPELRTISYVTPGSADVSYIREVETFCGVAGAHLFTQDLPLFSTTTPRGALPHGHPPLQRAAAMAVREQGAVTLLTGQAGDLLLGNWIDDSLQTARFVRRGRLGRAWREALTWSQVTRIPAPHILARAVAATLATGPSRGLWSAPDLASTKLSHCSLPADLLRRTGLERPADMFSAEWMDAPVERRSHFRAVGVMRQLRVLQPLEPMEGIDYTHPFAHRPLVEFLMSVPADVLCRPGQPRRLMHRSLSALWPRKLRARRSKALFGGAYLEAFRPFAKRLLRERRYQVVERGWVDRASFTARLERLSRGLECHQPQLRQILLLENWLRPRGDMPDDWNVPSVDPSPVTHVTIH